LQKDSSGQTVDFQPNCVGFILDHDRLVSPSGQLELASSG
jgi:hypothetical protein